MTQLWRERLAWWWCDHFGHNLYGEPLLNGKKWCRRCGRSALPKTANSDHGGEKEEQ